MSTALEIWTDVAEKMPVSAITGTPRDSSQIQPWTGTVTGVIFRHMGISENTFWPGDQRGPANVSKDVLQK